MLQGSPAEVGARFLEGALVLAEQGSWERIAVGRAWYLGGDKAKGQQIFDGVTSGRKVEGSDWFRIGSRLRRGRRVAQGARGVRQGDRDERRRRLGDDRVRRLREREQRSSQGRGALPIAMQKKPKEFWHWVNAGGSYLGVKPQ